MTEQLATVVGTEIDRMPFTPRELDAMKAVWRRGGEATVYDFLEDLPDDTPYTSALSTFQALEGKGFLDHRREGRKYVYLATVTWEDCRKAALRRVLSAYYEGDATLLAVELERIREDVDG